MSQKPFGTLDLSGHYIVHDVTLFAHDHPTQPDGLNAGVKALEAALKAFDLDDYDLGGGGSARVVIQAASSLTLTAEQCPGDTTIIVGGSGVEITFPPYAELATGVEILITNPAGFDNLSFQNIGSRFIFPTTGSTSYREQHDTVTQHNVSGGEHIRVMKSGVEYAEWCVLSWTGQWWSAG